MRSGSRSQKRGKGIKKEKKIILAICLCMNLLIASMPTKVQAATGPTLGEYILTYIASLGVTFTDSKLLSAIKSHCGMGISGIDLSTIQSAISAVEGEVGYTPISSLISNTAEMGQAYATAVGAENFGATSIGAATAAENIHASIIQFPTTQSVATVAGGTPILASALQLTGAIAAGVGLGIMLNKVNMTLKDWVLRGQKGTFANGVLTGACVYGQGWYQTWSYEKDVISGWAEVDGIISVYVVNNSDKILSRCSYGGRGNVIGNSSGCGHSGQIYPGTYVRIWDGTNPQGTPLGDPASWIGKRYNGSNIDTVVTPNGVAGPNNLWGEEFFNPDEERLTPFSMQEYENWAQQAAQNISEGSNGENEWNDFKIWTQPYILPVIGPGGVPVGPLPGTESTPVYPAQPEYVPYPENNPQPVPTTIPGTTPGVDPNPTLAPGATPGVMPEPTALPIVPPQEELDPQEQTEMLGQTTINGLASIFPFCIPFDLKDLITKFNSIERKAPIITWNADFGGYGNFGDVTIDLSRFDNAAYIFRLLISIEYLIGLMLLSRYIIGGN